MHLLIRIFLCLTVFGWTLYQIVSDQNALILLRREIPVLAKRLHMLEKDNDRLRYEYAAWANPMHLWELSQAPELGHLHFPLQNEVWILDEPPSL